MQTATIVSGTPPTAPRRTRSHAAVQPASGLAILTKPSLPVALLLALLALPMSTAAQSNSPSARLHAALPEMFPLAGLVEAAEVGEQGARLVETTSRQRELGFRAGDVIIAVEGQMLVGVAWPDLRLRGSETFTVLRRLEGERPVLPPEVLARRILSEFVQLQTTARTPMRLARMLANQRTLVKDGVGVLLLPSAAGQDDREWLRVANPMPRRSEEAVQELRQALVDRVRLPAISTTEAEAARDELRKQNNLEALERAGRALATYVVGPQRRRQRQEFDEIVALWSAATSGLEEQRRELLAPSPRFGLFVEGSLNRIQEFLPQTTLIQVENSTGYAFQLGFRMRLLSGLDLLLEYGQARNTFEGPKDPCDNPGDICADDDGRRSPRVKTLLQPVVAELAYRPRLLKNLKPLFRAGFGVFHITSRILDDNEVELERATDTEFGAVLGGGIDVFYLKNARLRGTVGGTYRILTHAFSPVEFADWELGENVNPDQFMQLLRELQKTTGGLFELDMNGWQLGFMLSYDF